MRKGKQIIGKDVLSLSDGRRLYAVKDVLLGSDPEVVALLVDEGGLLSSSLVVPFEEIHSFGRDAVVVREVASVGPADKHPRVRAIVDRKEKLIGKKVYTENGDDQGTISDVYFDERSGGILGFEVSGGVVANVARGNSYLPLEDVIRTGIDVAYIRPQGVDRMESQVGGVQGAVGGARDKLGVAADTAKTKVMETGDRAKANAASARPEDNLVGRRAAEDVTDDNGRVLVAANQRITDMHVEEARRTGRLQDLTAAVAKAQAEDAKAKAGVAAEQVGDTAAGLWDQFTRKISDMTDATGRRVDEERTKKRLSDIEDAVGRPVSKVILDRDDEVILDLGEIITHEAIQRAYDANALDGLLNSVYKGDVVFEKDEMRVGQSGSATVEKASGEAPLLEQLEGKVEAAESERAEAAERGKAEAEQGRQAREGERNERSRQRERGETERGAAETTVTAGRARGGTR
jgi:uncharacterized protein YrrD